MSATREEIREALDDYVEQANANPRVERLLRDWHSRIHVRSSDSDATFTLVIEKQRIAGVLDGLEGDPDLIMVAEGSELSEIFWGEANPVERYNQGALKIRGAQEHLMRLDAIAMLVFLGG